MIGIVYRKLSKQIIAVITDVSEYTETDVIGKDASVTGIDLSQATFCIVESTELQVGDTLGEFIDARGQLPPTDINDLKSRQAEILIAMVMNDLMDWFKTVKDYYDTIVDGNRLYTKAQVAVFVQEGKLTPEQYELITGEMYA